MNGTAADKKVWLSAEKDLCNKMLLVVMGFKQNEIALDFWYSSTLTFNLLNCITAIPISESLSHVDTSNISPCCQATTHLMLCKLVSH